MCLYLLVTGILAIVSKLAGKCQWSWFNPIDTDMNESMILTIFTPLRNPRVVQYNAIRPPK